jgi:hypothetical protein
MISKDEEIHVKENKDLKIQIDDKISPALLQKRA